MSCQCYQIGGPFISFDPDCPAHGLEAQAREREQEREDAERAAREQAREQLLLEQSLRITELEQTVAQLRDEIACLRGG